MDALMWACRTAQATSYPTSTGDMEAKSRRPQAHWWSPLQGGEALSLPWRWAGVKTPQGHSQSPWWVAPKPAALWGGATFHPRGLATTWVIAFFAEWWGRRDKAQPRREAGVQEKTRKGLVFNHSPSFFFLSFLNNFIYLLAVLGLRCCAGFLLVVVSGGYSLLWCAGFSVRWLLLLWNTGFSIAACGFTLELSCSVVCGILQDQGSNQCLLHW